PRRKASRRSISSSTATARSEPSCSPSRGSSRASPTTRPTVTRKVSCGERVDPRRHRHQRPAAQPQCGPRARRQRPRHGGGQGQRLRAWAAPDGARAAGRRRFRRSAPSEQRLLTHLSCANERDDAVTRAQLQRFREATGSLPYAVSIANSAGLFGAVALGCDWVRPGIALYGASPFDDCIAADLGLEPVMRLESSVIAVRRVARGESVGYGGAWVAKRDSAIAVIAAGYGDGLHRSLGGGAPVLIDGRRAPLAGRVSMDMMAVDVSELAGVRVGTPVLLWGPGLAVEEVARNAGTIPYELLCAVSQRVRLVVNRA